MTPKEPTTDDQPATQNDLETWGGNLALRLEAVEQRLDTLATKDDLAKGVKQIMDHIEAVIENRWLDLGGAKREEVLLVKEQTAQLRNRVTTLERHAGLSG